MKQVRGISLGSPRVALPAALFALLLASATPILRPRADALTAGESESARAENQQRGRKSEDKPPTWAQSKEKPGKSEPAAASASPLVEERGKLRILLDRQQIGAEEFQISPEGTAAGAKEWTAHGATEIRLPEGGAAKVSGRLKLAANGAPLRYQWSAQGQKKASATIEFEGGTAKIALQLEGAQPFLQELSFGSPRVVVLDNNLYHHFALLARFYDWKARGVQTFPVLIPQDMTPGSITVEALGAQQVDGAQLELLRVRTADIEINLYLDGNHRLARLAVPASKALILRE